MSLKAGDWVTIRTKEEILRTLDKSGRLDELPLMPQMLKYCGQRFKVYKRAHKTCDTVNPIAGRRLRDTVHLELRCDGKAYSACQASCLIFWKEAWLKPEGGASDNQTSGNLSKEPDCTEEAIWNSSWEPDAEAEDGKRYFCQATQLPRFTAPLQWWDLRQYIEDYTSGNVSAAQILKSFLFKAYCKLAINPRIAVGPALIRVYDSFQLWRGGTVFPIRRGRIPAGRDTPIVTLNLQPGEWVRVKHLDEIIQTYDTNYKNRGLVFDKEMVPYCGKKYRVLRRVEKILNEKTGRIQYMKTPSVILDTVVCQGRYSECRLFCPRAIFPFWREAWLERVGSLDEKAVATSDGARWRADLPNG